MNRNLTSSEYALLKSLPSLPALAEIQTTNIWIIEWLSPGERQTGKELNQWIEKQRPGWSIYNPCSSKDEVLNAIERATEISRRTGMIPILHIESHGSELGLAPSSIAREELLSWSELTIPLQNLNVATKCNLILVVAACLSFAAIAALTQGPRAPVVALVGTNATLNESDLLLGMKELYRRFRDEDAQLLNIAESASREMRGVGIEIELFATLAYEALAEQLVRDIRPNEQQASIERLRQRMQLSSGLTYDEIENKLAELTGPVSPQFIQAVWDYMFMIDLEPNNKNIFGVDWQEIIKCILKAQVD